MRRLLLLILLLGISLIATSCREESSRKRMGNRARNYRVEDSKDRSISEQVRSSLKNYYNLSFKARYTARVSTHEGLVTIKGLIINKQERTTILKLIKQIPGVRDVYDELKENSHRGDIDPCDLGDLA